MSKFCVILSALVLFTTFDKGYSQMLGEYKLHNNPNHINIITPYRDSIMVFGPDVYQKLSQSSDFTHQFLNNSEKAFAEFNTSEIAPDGSVWLGGDGKIHIYKDYSWTTFGEDSLKGTIVSDILFDSTGTLWIGTWSNGLFKYKDKVWQNMLEWTDSLPNYRVSAIAEEKTGKIWFGTRNGEFGYVDSIGVHKINHGLEIFEGPFDITQMEYNHDILWIAASNGLFKFSNDEIIEIARGGVSSFVIDSSYLYLGRSVSGLGRYDINSGEWEQLVEDDIIQSINDMKLVNNTIWIGTDWGLFRYYIPSSDLIHARRSSLSNNWVKDVSFDSQGNIWAVGYPGGISFFKDSQWNSYDFLTNRYSVVSSVLVKNDSTVFIGSKGQLIKLHISDTITKVMEAPWVGDINILKKNSKGDLIVASNDIRILGDSDTIVVDEKRGFPFANIRDIAVDNDDNIWAIQPGVISFIKTDTVITLRAGHELPHVKFLYEVDTDSHNNVFVSYYSNSWEVKIAQLDENYNLIDIELPNSKNYEHFFIDEYNRIWLKDFFRDYDGKTWISFENFHPEKGMFATSLQYHDPSKTYVVASRHSGLLVMDVSSFLLDPGDLKSCFEKTEFCSFLDSLEIEFRLDFDCDSIDYGFINQLNSTVEVIGDSLLRFDEIEPGKIGLTTRRYLGSYVSNWSDTVWFSFQKTIQIKIDTLICEGDSLLFGGHYIAEEGYYYYLEELENNCDIATNLLLDFYPMNSFSLGNDTIIGVDDMIILFPDHPDINSLLWTNSSTLPFYNFTADEPGEYIVGLEVIDNNNCKSYDSIYIRVEAILGVPGVDIGTIRLFPNPTKDRLFVESDRKIKKIEIYSISGVKLLEKVFHGISRAEMVTHSLNDGVYVVVVEDEKNIHIHKVEIR